MTTVYIRKGFILILSLFAFVLVEAQGLLTTQIKDLNATSRNGNVQLSWKTEYEQNLAQFEVEYSDDGGRYFRNLGFIPATNRLNGDFYQFTHTVSYTDSAIYRLKILDSADRWVYTEPVVYHVNKITAFFVYPSVITTGTLNIFTNDPFNSLQMVAMNGTVVLKQNLSGKMGRFNIPLSKSIGTGTYVVQLADKNRVITQKVIIQ